MEISDNITKIYLITHSHVITLTSEIKNANDVPMSSADICVRARPLVNEVTQRAAMLVLCPRAFSPDLCIVY